jgi:hypothetical protein
MLILLDLYGTAMVEPLPEKDFDFLLDEQVENFDVTTVPDDGETGYFLEVDLEYPDDLHESHSDYPLAPEPRSIDPEELSPYTKSLAAKLGVKPSSKCKKLVSSLQPKERYVVHYRTLKLYLRLGMKIKKIHRIISFTQSCWLKRYIDFNTEQRQKATNAFDRDMFKLKNNAVFGKTMVSRVP